MNYRGVLIGKNKMTDFDIRNKELDLRIAALKKKSRKTEIVINTLFGSSLILIILNLLYWGIC